MGSGFQFIDIILFAMIAAFLILRLRGVLGRRDGHEGGYHDPFKADASEEMRDDNVIQLSDGNVDTSVEQEVANPESGSPENIEADEADEADGGVLSGLSKIRAADNEFDEEDFLVGARVAFEMILGAYVAGDRETLQNLLSAEVYDQFCAAIEGREKSGHVMEETLVGIRAAEIVEASMEGNQALVTTKILSEQVHVLRDGEGQVIDGNPNQVTDAVDFWTFARDTESSDPNWQLVATQSLD